MIGMIQDLSKKSKSGHGNDFKKEVLMELKRTKQNGIINTIETSKFFANDTVSQPQFYTPFFIQTKSAAIAIFSTTSARSDRIKINQWDAEGIKKSALEKIYCILVLPDMLNKLERQNFDKESSRITQVGYISALDRILQLKNLEKYISSV